MQDLELWSFASAEAQVAAIADDIAYDAHDIDDGLRAELFALDDLAAVDLFRDILDEIRSTSPGFDATRTAHELVRRLITRLIEDVIAETDRRLQALRAGSADDVRGAAQPVGAFSAAMAEADRAIKVSSAHIGMRGCPHHGRGAGWLASVRAHSAASRTCRRNGRRRRTKPAACAALPISSPDDDRALIEQRASSTDA